MPKKTQSKTPAPNKKRTASKSQKTYTELMLCHLSGLAMYVFPFGHLILPFLIWQLKKGEVPALDAHGKEVMNFQISMTIYGIVAFVLVFMLVGVPLIIALMVLHIVLVIRGALMANEGKFYSYPFTIHFLK